MPKKFEDMVKGIWDSIRGKKNPRTGKPFTESDAYAMATAKWKEMGHKAPKHESLKDWHVMEFFIPITESTSVGNDFFIRGVAINETTTRNGIKYVATELEKAAPTFKGKKILLDHRNEVKSIVGTVTNSSFNNVKKSIDFEAKIMDKEIQNMINDGRISDVSIGAKVQDLVQNKDDKCVTAIGIEGLEISLVAVPGDPGANIATAFEECLTLKERYELVENYSVEEIDDDYKDNDINSNKMKGGKLKMVEEIKTEGVTTENIQKIEVKADISGVNSIVKEEVGRAIESSEKKTNEMFEKIMKELELLKQPPAKMEIEVKTEKKDSTKGIVTEEVKKVESKGDIVFEMADTGKGFQIYRDYNKENSNKFKRLIR